MQGDEEKATTARMDRNGYVSKEKLNQLATDYIKALVKRRAAKLMTIKVSCPRLEFEFDSAVLGPGGGVISPSVGSKADQWKREAVN
jgi:hypothetical protein